MATNNIGLLCSGPGRRIRGSTESHGKAATATIMKTTTNTTTRTTTNQNFVVSVFLGMQLSSVLLCIGALRPFLIPSP